MHRPGIGTDIKGSLRDETVENFEADPTDEGNNRGMSSLEKGFFSLRIIRCADKNDLQAEYLRRLPKESGHVIHTPEAEFIPGTDMKNDIFAADQAEGAKDNIRLLLDFPVGRREGNSGRILCLHPEKTDQIEVIFGAVNRPRIIMSRYCCVINPPFISNSVSDFSFRTRKKGDQRRLGAAMKIQNRIKTVFPDIPDEAEKVPIPDRAGKDEDMIQGGMIFNEFAKRLFNNVGE